MGLGMKDEAYAAMLRDKAKKLGIEPGDPKFYEFITNGGKLKDSNSTYVNGTNKKQKPQAAKNKLDTMLKDEKRRRNMFGGNTGSVDMGSVFKKAFGI